MFYIVNAAGDFFNGYNFVCGRFGPCWSNHQLVLIPTKDLSKCVEDLLNNGINEEMYEIKQFPR